MIFSLLDDEISSGVVLQYAIYGSIIVVGLIVLFIMRRFDKRPNMVIAKSKTEKLIKKIEKLLDSDSKDYLYSAKVTKLTSSIGDLVVLAEKEVTGNRNVVFEGVLIAYKNAYAQLDADDLFADKEKLKQQLLSILDELKTAQKYLNEMVA